MILPISDNCWEKNMKEENLTLDEIAGLNYPLQT
jgi:hypothetical protein